MARLDELTAAEPRAITDGPFGSNLKSSHYTDTGVRVIRLQNIGDGKFRDERSYISHEHFERLKAHEIRTDDLAFASLGEDPPRVCILPDLNSPAIVKADCIRLRLHPEISSRWAITALMASATRTQVRGLVKGVGRPRLGLAQIRSIAIPVPPPREQLRINEAVDEILATLQKSSETLLAAIPRSRRLRRGMLRSLIAAPWPKNWRVVTVADAGKVDLGRQRHPDWHNGDHLRPYLRVANVFEDRLDLGDVMEMDFPPEVFARFKLVAGDILLNEGQSPHLLGRPAMYRGEPENMAFTNSLLRFRANPEVLPEWALLVFRHYMHSGRFTQEVRITTNIAHLSAGRFKSIEFPIPPLVEQQHIIDIAHRDMSHQIELERSLETATARADGLRQAVLDAAYCGDLVSRAPADEPADVLLARIRAERESAAAAAKATRKPRTRKATTP